MDRRNFRKPEQPDRKTERKDRGDLKKLSERLVNNDVETDLNARVAPDSGDATKRIKPDRTKKLETQGTADSQEDRSVNKVRTDIPRHRNPDVFNTMLAPERGDVNRKAKLERTKKIMETERHDEPHTDSYPKKTDTERSRSKNVDFLNARAQLDNNERLRSKNIDFLNTRAQLDSNESDRKAKTKIPLTKKNVELQRNDDPRVDNSVKKIQTEIIRNKTLYTDNIRMTLSDKEDLDRKTRADKTKIPVTKKVVENQRNEDRTDHLIKKAETDSTLNRNAELDEKRRIRERYTIRTKNQIGVIPANAIRKEIVNAKTVNVGRPNLETSKIVSDRPTKKPSGVARDKLDSTPASKDSVDKDVPPQKRPIVRTITSKNDATKIYKAVTFVERKRQKPTTLQVKLPSPKTSETSAVSKKVTETSIEESIDSKEKSLPPKKKRGKKKKQRFSESPDTLVRKSSPQTEVAKWAPSCINKHTKPYYEAWISTTLNAISKASKKDKLFLEKQNILQTFQRALAMRPETPDLVYENFSDERYTGRIKVRQR